MIVRVSWHGAWLGAWYILRRSSWGLEPTLSRTRTLLVATPLQAQGEEVQTCGKSRRVWWSHVQGTTKEVSLGITDKLM